MSCAVIGNAGHGQERDPFFTAQSDWTVFDGNVGREAGESDGHGIYVSNGGDWNILRNNETHSNASSGFQINADPASTCVEDGIAFNDPLCDSYAGGGEGGRGASDYFLVENNYFHHDNVGANFTSLRLSVIRNNVFGASVRHNVSFWQESDNPKLGSTDNKILHNLFVSTGRAGVQFQNYALRNSFANNVLLGVSIEDGTVAADPQAIIMEIDLTSDKNLFVDNFYGAGQVLGKRLARGEISDPGFSTVWFSAFPTDRTGAVTGFAPRPTSPFLNRGNILVDSMTDRLGELRSVPTDLGPIELQ